MAFERCVSIRFPWCDCNNFLFLELDKKVTTTLQLPFYHCVVAIIE